MKGPGPALRMLKVFRIFRILKMFRLFRLKRLMDKYSDMMTYWMPVAAHSTTGAMWDSRWFFDERG